MSNFLRVKSLSSALSLALSLCLFNAASAEDGYSNDYGKCMDASDGVTANMLDCQSSELKVQDKLLNDAYKKAMAVLDGEQKKLLKEGQRAWIKMRDADSGLLRGLSGGSIDALNASSLYLDYTVDRVRFLQGLSE